MADAHQQRSELTQIQPAEKVGAYLAMSPTVLMDRAAVGLDRFDGRVFEIESDDLDRAWPAEAGVGKWPIRVLIGHLADAETSFVHRMRRVVAEPGCELSAWDEQAFLDAGHYGVVAMTEGGEPTRPPIGAAAAVIHTLRQWSDLWLRGLPSNRWRYAGMHPERGPMSLHDLLAYNAWHLDHHAYFCNQKIVKLLGEA